MSPVLSGSDTTTGSGSVTSSHFVSLLERDMIVTGRGGGTTGLAHQSPQQYFFATISPMSQTISSSVRQSVLITMWYWSESATSLPKYFFR